MKNLTVNFQISQTTNESVKETLKEGPEVLFYQKVLEILRHRARFEYNLPLEGGETASFKEEMQTPNTGEFIIDELEYQIADLAQELTGPQTEDQTDEAYEELISATAEVLQGCCLDVIDDALANGNLEDFAGLCEFDFTKNYDMTWKSTEVNTDADKPLVRFTFVLTQ